MGHKNLRIYTLWYSMSCTNQFQKLTKFPSFRFLNENVFQFNFVYKHISWPDQRIFYGIVFTEMIEYQNYGNKVSV